MRRDLRVLDSESGLLRAVDWLKAGRVAVLPTETVYGLGADATSSSALSQIYKIKQRPPENPLIVHYANWQEAQQDVIIEGTNKDLCQNLTPGPLTMVLNQREDSRIDPIASAYSSSLAIRIPSYPFMQRLLAALPFPLAMPSANASGSLTSTQIHHTYGLEHGEEILFVKGDLAGQGIESTILDLRLKGAPRILRPGAVTYEELQGWLPELASPTIITDDQSPISPGLGTRHYAPRFPIRLAARTLRPGETGLAFAGVPAGAKYDLSSSGDLEEAGRHLFSYLYMLEEQGIERLAIGPIPECALGIAINDRLRRASTPA